MGNFFSSDGPIFQFLDRMGHLIIINLLWILCCLPVVTILPATTAFYYTVIKSIRRGHGYPTKEFLQSFRNNLRRGIPLNLILIIIGFLLYAGLKQTVETATKQNIVMIIVYLIIIIFYAGFLALISPVLSRFSIQTVKLCKMTAAMVFRHLPVTILLTAGTCGCGVLMYSAVLASMTEETVSPALVLFLLLPGIWCYVSTCLMEPVLKKYMPPPQDGEKAWYYE